MGKIQIQSYILRVQGFWDGYTKRFNEIVSRIPGKTKCIDDTLLWSSDLKKSVEWFDICHGITLNPEFGADTVSFANFKIIPGSVRPVCPVYLDTITNFPIHLFLQI